MKESNSIDMMNTLWWKFYLQNSTIYLKTSQGVVKEKKWQRKEKDEVEYDI